MGANKEDPDAGSKASGSDQMSEPWEKLLDDSPSDKVIPKIIRTRPSFGEIQQANPCISITPDPNSLSPNRPPPPGVGRLTRTQSLGNRRISSGNGILGNFHRQLRFSLRNDGGKEGGPLFRYRQARYASRRARKRVVFKHGDCNVVQGNVAKRRKRYLQDLFTTLVDAQWRWTLLVFAMSFILSWLSFALVWWLIAYSHGDTDPDFTDTPCVTGVNSFPSSFLFSVETQHTIGYGGRATTEECPEAIFVMCLQSIVGVFIQAFMVGIVFAKLSRPKKRAQTLLFSQSAVICQRDGDFVIMFRVGDMRKSHIIEAHIRAQFIKSKVGLIFAKLARAKKRTTTLLFSRNACVCLRDGQFCLLFRVGDIRKSHILEAHVRAQVIRKKVTKEGELLPFYQQELKVGADGEEDRLMFIWPTTIVHKINESSPLYSLSASDMLRERFEIVVMLEGVIESTGMTTQARSSYLPSEIFWGHRFEPIVAFKKETGEYEVDYTLFNNTYEVDTPLCSARQLDQLRANVSSTNKQEHLAITADGIQIGASPSNDTLDSCSVESMSLDDHIVIKIPDERIKENRKLAERNDEASSQSQLGIVTPAESGIHTGSSQMNGLSEQSINEHIIQDRPSSEQNGVMMNGHHHHHNHNHNNNKKHHFGSHHQLNSNNKADNVFIHKVNESKLNRSQSGLLLPKAIPELPSFKSTIPIGSSRNTPPPDLV